MQTLNLTSIPTHFGEARIAQMGPRDRSNGISPIEHRLTYINNLPVPVVVAWRSGLKFTLQPNPSLENQSLLMRTEIIVTPQVKFDIQRLLSAVDDNSTAELKSMRDAFKLQVKGNFHGGATLVLDYPLTLDKLREFGGTVYYSELDCVVSLLQLEDVPPHPYSEAGRRSQTITDSPIDHGRAGFGYAVEIVDNAGKYGERYLNISGTVYKVSPMKDWERRDGIYIVSNYAARGELGPDGLNVTHYPFELAEADLGLYRSFDEAKHLGDISTGRKEHLASLEHQLTIAKAELQRAKVEHDTDMVERNRELQRLEAETVRLKGDRDRLEHEHTLERARLKDYYESRAHFRKDHSEAIKILPSIIVGIGAIFMAIKTFFPSGK